MTTAQEATAESLRTAPRATMSPRIVNALVVAGSVAFALLLWELVSRSGLVREQDLPTMTATVGELGSLARTGAFWSAFLHTVRGWALGLGIAILLAVPIGVGLGLSDFAGRAFRVPVEFLRPIPSAALIPLLFLTLGTTLESEVFLAAFGAFWPILVQTMYGVRDVDPVTIDTARSFGVPQPRAAVANHPPERGPVHRDRDADRLGGRSDPRVHGRALHGDAGARDDAQLRPVVRPDDAALRTRARNRRARDLHASSCSRRSSGGPCAGIRRSGSVRREPTPHRGAQARDRDRGSRSRSCSSGRPGRGRPTASSGRRRRRSRRSSGISGSSRSFART